MAMRYTPIAERDLAYFDGNDELLALHQEMRRADEAWRGARAYDLGYDTVRALCEQYIAANYSYQKARWGRIRTHLRASDVMR